MFWFHRSISKIVDQVKNLKQCGQISHIVPVQSVDEDPVSLPRPGQPSC